MFSNKEPLSDCLSLFRDMVISTVFYNIFRTMRAYRYIKTDCMSTKSTCCCLCLRWCRNQHTRRQIHAKAKWENLAATTAASATADASTSCCCCFFLACSFCVWEREYVSICVYVCVCVCNYTHIDTFLWLWVFVSLPCFCVILLEWAHVGRNCHMNAPT